MTLVLPLEGIPTKVRTKPPATKTARKTRKRSRLWQLLMATTVLVAIAGGGAYAWTAQHPAAAPVSTVAVARGNVETTVLATGTLEASTLVSVGAQTSGTVKSVNFQLGDAVKAGDVVAEIDSLNQENALKVAQAALDNVNAQKAQEQANLATYQRALTRAETLNKTQLVSQADYDTAQNNVDISNAKLKALDAQIEQAQLAVSSAQLNLDRTKITAPVDGTVVAVLVEAGQSVNAAQSAPTVMKIADLDTMEIKAEISEADVAKVKAGQKVSFTTLGDPTHPITATLKSIEPAPSSIATDDDTTSSSTSTAIYYNGIFEVPNPDHALRIDMTAKVTIVLDDAQNVLTLPASALGTAGRDGKYHVRVLDPVTGETTTKTVTVGLNNKVTAEVADGLSEGDKVVASHASAPTTSTATTGNRNAGGPPAGLGF